MKIKLIDFSGEFCGRRTTPGLSQLRDLIRSRVKQSQPLIIDTVGVKTITPSYIDELLPPLMIELGKENVLNNVSFDPPLQGFALKQIERGYKNRIQ